MNGWQEGGKEQRMEGQEKMEGWRKMNKEIKEAMTEWINELMNKWTNRQTNKVNKHMQK